MLKYLAKIAVEAETVVDGAQCTDTVFSKPAGYYSIVLVCGSREVERRLTWQCDLHMPNKDGYQACREIRQWEKGNQRRMLPIVALSANVLGDVYAKCVDAGFNSYVTKPVEFKELSAIMAHLLEPQDPTKDPELMRAHDG